MSEEKEQAENYAERNHWSFHKMMFKHPAQFNSTFHSISIIYQIPGKLLVVWRLTKLNLALKKLTM